MLQRKKVIFLHWFHHTTVLLYCWHAFHHEIAPGIWFAAMNYGVHMIMYSYYCAMACRLRRLASMIAPVITVLQITQMVVGSVVTVYSAAVHMGGGKCKVDPANYRLGLAMYLSYFALFCMLFYSKYLSRPPAAGARAKRVQANGAAGAGAAFAGPSNIEDFCAATHKVARNTDAGGFFHVRSESISSGVASASASPPAAGVPATGSSGASPAAGAKKTN